jgi:hypothetical protein
VNGVFVPVFFHTGPYWIAWFDLVAFCLAIISVYGFPDKSIESSEVDDFSKVIADVSNMSKQLATLGTFLEQQQRRISDSQATLSQLQDEKTKLEPIVLSQKETVEAILSAHAERTAKSALKERLIGFLLGIFASICASVIFEYLKH